MTWTFSSDRGISREKKTIEGCHDDWSDIGELPESMYEQLECGHVTADDVEVGDRILAYWGNSTPVNRGTHPSRCLVYDKSPFLEENYGKSRRIGAGRIQIWKGTGADGKPITAPARRDLSVEILERDAGENIDRFNC